MSNTTDELSEIVRGEWAGQGGAGWLCRYGDPECVLSYKLSPSPDNCLGDWKASVSVGRSRGSMEADAFADTPTDALRALIDRWRDEIDQFAGTIHPDDLEADRE